MTGEELYEIYRRAHVQHDILVDDWDDLDEGAQAVWNTFANDVTDEVGK